MQLGWLNIAIHIGTITAAYWGNFKCCLWYYIINFSESINQLYKFFNSLSTFVFLFVLKITTKQNKLFFNQTFIYHVRKRKVYCFNILCAIICFQKLVSWDVYENNSDWWIIKYLTTYSFLCNSRCLKQIIPHKILNE